MAYLAHSAHLQFLGLIFGFVGLIITACLSGVNDWRIWYLDDQSIISGGLAWVGVWRACFNSHILDSSEFCKSISLTDSFTPPEIAAAQVLCMTAVGVGVVANLVAGYAVRNAYFGVDSGRVRLAFVTAGSLFWLTAACSLVPVLWNMSSVLANLTIDFPPDFYLPPAPIKQEVGPGIAIGICSSVLLIVSGLFLMCYKDPVKTKTDKSIPIEHLNNINVRAESSLDTIKESRDEGVINPAFEMEKNI
ncbi:claudin-34 [Triplophysa rosa]|uniref:Claudin-1 n=1 Tax=Triplophysa rosa TaxID=992332 RepID=A0A9W7WS53_TRIRA|nr:claudin-34 [Triplophysa rosa]KAI7807334.1 putative claudin-1 [Triplophysa rosa]